MNKTFLSFNPDDRENVWSAMRWDIPRHFVPFAVDDAGNAICFDKRDHDVVFVNHETGAVELAAPDFGCFIVDLY